MNTLAFRRTLLSVSHPLSIAAIIVVLLNDHWWRRVAPSWFTGKIGDFAWLIFAPFLLAALLAWVFPRRERLVGYASIIGVGLIFGLAKTVPAFHALTIDVLELLTGWPNILRMDPTDLIALPALLIAWRIWEQSAPRSFRLADRGWVLLPLAVLATMADSPAPNLGITSFCQKDGQIFTGDIFASYTSVDGGLTWQASTTPPKDQVCDKHASEVVSPSDPRLRFRYDSAGVIERSDDGGQTWQREYAVAPLSQAQSAYARQGSPTAVLWTGPLNIMIDARTGNALFALGHQGVLVRTPAGEWRTAKVGPYHAIDLRRPEEMISLLSGEMLLAGVLIVLVIAVIAPLARSISLLPLTILVIALGGIAFVVTGIALGSYDASLILPALLVVPIILLIYIRRGGRGATLTSAALAVSWVGWLATWFIAAPAMATGYLRGIPVLGAIAAAIFGVPVALKLLVGVFRVNPKAARLTIGWGALTALLFMVPFIVWAQDGIPYYYTAVVYGMVLVAVMCFVGYRYLHQYVSAPASLTRG
ncbi:MAG TPA: hypothetical protein VLG46_13525 [Anaerolineae bacterium]|nr:hypothetical protein [Anaerolineae bacterium]